MTDFNLVLSQVRQRLEILYQIVDELEAQGGGGGQGGTDNYNELSNKPKINNITLSGNKTGEDLGLADYAALADKADKSTTYTKTQVDAALDAKADKSTTYTKTEVNTALSAKADKSTTYTKTQVDTALAGKADAATTYTKTETDSAITSGVTAGINALDATTVGGSGKYISSIYEENGIIYATPSTIQTSVGTSINAVSSKAVKTYVDDAVATKASITDIYGPGIEIPDGDDLNDDEYKVPGVYYRKSTSTTEYVANTPVTSNYFKIIVEWVYPDYRLRQTFISLSRDCTYYMRVYDSGGWQSWNRFRSNEQTLLGVFGVNDATIIPATGLNLDTLTTPGVWISGSTTGAEKSSGRPDYANSGSKIFRLEVKALSSTRPIQEMYVYRMGTSEGEFAKYQRMSRTNGTWNSWQQIDTTDVQTYYPPAQQSSNSLQLTRPDAELTVEPIEPDGEVDA